MSPTHPARDVARLEVRWPWSSVALRTRTAYHSSMRNIRIRAYESQDLTPLLRVLEAASRAGHPFLPDSFILAERGRIRRYLPMFATWVAMSRQETLELDVFEENPGARAFYRRCGFIEDSEHEHAGSGGRMVRMSYEAPQGGDPATGTGE